MHIYSSKSKVILGLCALLSNLDRIGKVSKQLQEHTSWPTAKAQSAAIKGTVLRTYIVMEFKNSNMFLFKVQQD